MAYLVKKKRLHWITFFFFWSLARFHRPGQDHKLKHMADLQQSVVTDGDTRHQIQQQILQWEENLERLHCEQFRLRCYMASLQNGELPNPKVRKRVQRETNRAAKLMAAHPMVLCPFRSHC